MFIAFMLSQASHGYVRYLSRQGILQALLMLCAVAVAWHVFLFVLSLIVLWHPPAIRLALAGTASAITQLVVLAIAAFSHALRIHRWDVATLQAGGR